MELGQRRYGGFGRTHSSFRDVADISLCLVHSKCKKIPIQPCFSSSRVIGHSTFLSVHASSQTKNTRGNGVSFR